MWKGFKAFLFLGWIARETVAESIQVGNPESLDWDARSRHSANSAEGAHEILGYQIVARARLANPVARSRMLNHSGWLPWLLARAA